MELQKELTENEILDMAAQTIDDEPIKIEIEVKPENFSEKIAMFFGYKKRKHTFLVSSINLGTLIRMSRCLLQMSYEDEPKDGNGALPWGYLGILNNAELAAKVIALAIHNKKSPLPEDLPQLILNNFDAVDIMTVTFNLVKRMNVKVFMNTITSIRQLQVLKEVPEVSPTPAEIIAPGQNRNEEPVTIDGELSVQLSSIFDGMKIK